MLVKYLRDIQGRKFGAVVATSPTEVGFSFLHDEDTHLIDSRNYQFDVAKSVEEAAKRAKLGYAYWEKFFTDKIMKRFKLKAENYTKEELDRKIKALYETGVVYEVYPKLAYVMDEMYIMRCRAQRVKNPAIFGAIPKE